MQNHLRALAVIATALLASNTRAQTSFPEAEPNSQKTEANPISLVAGDSITGVSTGTVSTLGDTTLASVDAFRVKTGALALGIYKHTLTLSSTTAGNLGSIRGVTQTAGVPNTVDASYQASSASANMWYGFGKQEELYYRVSGVATTTAAYTATLTTTPITPLVVAGNFNPGSITVRSDGLGHTTDTEIYVYDASLNPVPMGHNDDPGAVGPARLVITLPGGTYYVATSNHNTSNSTGDANAGESWLTGPLLDLPNAICNSMATTGNNLAFSVSDGVTTTVVPVTKAANFDVVWARFTVGTPFTTLCSGDGTDTPCPCTNPGLAGRGCENTVTSGGARLTATGSASVASPTLVMNSTFAVPFGPGLYYEGNATANLSAPFGVAFGNGLRCAGGATNRLEIRFADAAGAANSTVNLQAFGAAVSGTTYYYQQWYRDTGNVGTCAPGAGFNLSNAIAITWGP